MQEEEPLQNKTGKPLENKAQVAWLTCFEGFIIYWSPSGLNYPFTLWWIEKVSIIKHIKLFIRSRGHILSYN